MRHVLSTVVLVGVLSCSHSPAVQSGWTPIPPPRRDDEPRASAAPDAATVAQMHTLMETTETLREEASRGHCDVVRAVATEFVASLQPDPNTPEPWLNPLASIRAQAEVLAKHESDAEAATALARIASACGDCHVRADVQARVATAVADGAAPALGSTEADAMRVHDWATQRMWESLVIPDQDRWVEGTTMFVLLPSCVDLDPASEEHALRCTPARGIARRAHLVSDLEARTLAMADLLGTCSSGHRAASRRAGSSFP